MVVPLRMGWRRVLFANWPLDPELVEPHLPDELTLDTHDGSAWVSIVAFESTDARPRPVPRRLGVTVRGVNVRTYVRRGDRNGLYFLSLDAQGMVPVLGARLTHQLPYYYARISFDKRDGETRVDSRRRHPGAKPARFTATYEPTQSMFKAKPRSLEDFLTERYRNYTEAMDGTLRRTRVLHDPWPLQAAVVDIQENTLLEASGLPTPEDEPLVLYSPGVDATSTRSEQAETEPRTPTPP